MLPSGGNSAATQIDHILISNFGIFCIETKAYQGWIFGNANQDQWTQVIYHYKKRFYNPLRQNYAHIKAIENLLGSQKIKRPIVSLVAFPDAGRIKVSGTDSVGYGKDVINKIRGYIDLVYTDNERDEIVSLLIQNNIIDKVARKIHNKEVLTIKSNHPKMANQVDRKKGAVVIISNDKDAIALQLRAAHDDSFPSHWDFSAGGGIENGEDEKKSIEREIKEELGIEAQADFIAKRHYAYPAWKPGITRDNDVWIYKAKHNGPFTHDVNEVERVEFFAIEEIKKMIERGDKFHPEFILAWNEGIVAEALKTNS